MDLVIAISWNTRHIRKVNPIVRVLIFFRMWNLSLSSMYVILCSSDYMPKALALRLKLQLFYQLHKLWECGVVSLDTPVGLLNAVFFYNGKKFCLRGGAEHRYLKLSQIRKEVTVADTKTVNSYIYQEFGSKNNQGGFSSLNLWNKVVKQHESS